MSNGVNPTGVKTAGIEGQLLQAAQSNSDKSNAAKFASLLRAADNQGNADGVLTKKEFKSYEKSLKRTFGNTDKGQQLLQDYRLAYESLTAAQPNPDPVNPAAQPEPGPANPAAQPNPGPANPAAQPNPGPANPTAQPNPGPANPAAQPNPGPANPAGVNPGATDPANSAANGSEKLIPIDGLKSDTIFNSGALSDEDRADMLAALHKADQAGNNDGLVSLSELQSSGASKKLIDNFDVFAKEILWGGPNDPKPEELF